MAFASPSQLVEQYDSRRVRELASDTGTPVATGDLAANAVVLALLERATEMVLAHTRQGQKYTEAELQALADSGSAGWSLRGLVCDLTFGLLVLRRGTSAADVDRLCPMWAYAHQQLQLLAGGQLVFPRITGEEHETAGTPRTTDLQTQTTTPASSWVREASRIHPRDPSRGHYGAA